jgi:hypothetical protein
MMEWRGLRMSDLMLEFYDGPHATPPPADGGPVYLGIKNITDAGLLDLSEVRHIAEADFRNGRSGSHCGPVTWCSRTRPHCTDTR